MSVCDHDPMCRGPHYPEHQEWESLKKSAAALLDQLPDIERVLENAATVERTTRTNPSKDRRLSGKARKRARRGNH